MCAFRYTPLLRNAAAGFKNMSGANPKVFFDMTADGAPLGRIVMEVNPLTVWFLPSQLLLSICPVFCADQ